jgi:Predicted phosphoribosyltransferases
MERWSIFEDRQEAGFLLSEKLKRYSGEADAIVLALPRGGMPVAFEVATRLRLPLDVFVVRKLGVPGQVELAMGAIASGGVRVLNEDVIGYLQIADSVIASVAAQEQRELERREILYRKGRSPFSVDGKQVILIDDGLATGATMKAAVLALRKENATRIIVAVPVGAATTCAELSRIADEVICLRMPEPFYGVGHWYRDFSQTSDEEVSELIEKANYN